MTVTNLQRSIRRTRGLRVGVVLAVALNALILAAEIALGSLLVIVPAACIVALLVSLVAQTRMLATLRRRERELEELSRPRMTPEDYRRLREMEIELGWEPSESPDPPLPETGAKRDAQHREPVAPHPYLPGVCAHPPGVRTYVFTPQGAGPVSAYCGTCGLRVAGQPEQSPRTDELVRQQIIASQGIPPARSVPGGAPMTGPGGRWHPVSELAEHDARAAEHFAALGRLGWLEDERRETEPAATSPEPPADVYDRHFDGAGREWCRDGDGRCWIRPTPDSPWFLTRSGQ
jgi:hypothetical protein